MNKSYQYFYEKSNKFASRNFTTISLAPALSGVSPNYGITGNYGVQSRSVTEILNLRASPMFELRVIVHMAFDSPQAENRCNSRVVEIQFAPIPA